MVEVRVVSISNKAMTSFVMLSFAMPYVFCLDGCLYMQALLPMTPLLVTLI